MISDDPILKEAKKRLKWAMEAESKQREREKAALHFRVEQWDPDAIRARDGADGTVPRRPRLSIPKFLQPLNLVRNQFRSAHLGINVHPLNEKANKENAEVRQELIRRIEADSAAENVRFWAFDRAVQTGSGAYRVVTVYDDDTEDPFDQKLMLKRIYDQSLVLFDPAAQEPDRSDGKFAFVISWVSVDAFSDQFPNASMDYDDEAGETFDGIYATDPDWTMTDGERRAVQVVEYFRKVEKPARKRVMLDDRSSAWEDEVPKGRKVDASKEPREIQQTVVEIYTLTACEVLDKTHWPGKYIPLIPTIGEELQPYDGERRRMGMIEPAMDGCRGYNYSVSQAVETVALEPKAPYIGYEGQFEGHETKWNSVNTRNWNYLEVRPMTLDGKPAPLPQRSQADMSKLGMAIQLANQFDGDIQAATAVFDPSLGNLSPKERSGKAILALQQQGDAGTSHYIQNMAQISMRLEALILLDAMRYVYDRPGRIAQVLDAEERPRPVMLNAPFVIDQGSGMPVPAQNGQQGAKLYDMSNGAAYGVTITIGKAYASRLQQGAEQLTEMIGASPEMMMVFGDKWAQFLDVPGAPEIADRLRKIIEQKNPGLTQKEGAQPSAQQLQAMVQAKDAELKQIQQMLAQATQALETEMAKQQASLKKAEIDNASRQAIAEQGNAMKLMLERMQAQTDLLIQEMKSRDAEREREHEMRLERAKVGMAMAGAKESREHETDEAAREREHGSSEAERDREMAMMPKDEQE